MTPGLRRAKASALINLSDLLLLEAQPAEARATADRAGCMLRPLAEDAHPGTMTIWRLLLALALENRGAASGDAGERDGAARDLDEAARIARSVARGDESYDDAQFQLACVTKLRGELASKDASKLAKSEEDFGEAFRILARLSGDHGLIPHYREEMAAVLADRAGVRLAPAQIPEARQDCEAARGHLARLIEDRGVPENPRHLSLLGQVLERQAQIHFVEGSPAEGLSALAEAVKHLTRAVELDPARMTDRARLERIKAAAARVE
jgi:tetratricopeptide (TPR) repeat protein